MDVGFECQEEEIQGNFRKQLAAVVKTLQWCYAIFWGHSSCQKGLLVWSDGYYNGDIKTRKTTQPMELQADQLGIQRSEQLRELYESLSAGESSPPAKRPSASLSPEDLSDTEWYYLVCMSFTFTSDDGIPGKVLDDNQPIWLNDVQFADNKTFSRSLLAKSASIQTVVCFPFMDGILELGSTEMVPKDPDLAQQIITSFWQFTNPVISEQSISSAQLDDNLVDANFDHDDVDPIAMEYHDVSECLTPNNQNELRMSSPSDSIDEYLQNQEVENQHLMDNECNNVDCICVPVDFTAHGTHYTKTLAAILGNPKQQQRITSPLRENIPRSSFAIWLGASTSQTPLSVTPQQMLKKMIVNVTWKSGLQNGIHQNKNDDAGASHTISERRRREKLNEKFIILRSLVPSISKFDKASILGDTIEYLTQLERRVEELESCRELMDAEARERRKHPDVSERTSDNYGTQNASKKRKACSVDEPETEQHHWVLSKEGLVDVNVTLMQKDVVIEMHCPWRDSLLFDIVEAMNNLGLDSHSLQSNTEDGILAMTVKAKIKGTVSASVGAIRKALHRVLAKS